MQAQVKKMKGFRSGKGFSLSEIQEAGLSVPRVRTFGIHVDLRRKTIYDFNVKTLRMLIEEKQKQLEEEARKREREKAEREEKEVKRKAREKAKIKKKKEEKKKKEKAEEREKKEEIEKKVDITEIKGVGEKRAEALEAAGIYTVGDLLKADTEKVAEKTGFSSDYIEKLKEKARVL